jgi:4-hydroxy-3-methylbut-2-enyl diphosphate reductase
MKITIDDKAGYCFGVKNAIGQAEAMLEGDGTLFSLGHIVHNHAEVDRLAGKGLKVFDYDEFSKLQNCKVLIRAHGEPPSTYETAYRNNITLIDATCPIVKHLQGNIRTQNELTGKTNSQVVIYGKKGHPEVSGLVGQTDGQAIVVNDVNDIESIDPQRSVHLYAQTTMDPQGFDLMAARITAYLERHHTGNAPQVFIHNTICRQVSNRINHLEKFAAAHQVIMFASGKTSSNGRFLYNVCLKSNPKTYHIEEVTDIDPSWFDEIETVGITGATSTPVWQMEKVAGFLEDLKTK